MGFGIEIALAGATFKANRNGHPYDPTTGARTGALDFRGEHPDLAYRYPRLTDLEVAAKPYEGNVTAIQPGGVYRRIKSIDEGAVDYYAMQPDSSYVRSDRFGAATPEASLQLAPEGALATGEVGPTPSTPSTQTGLHAKLYRAEAGKFLEPRKEFYVAAGTAKWRSQGLGPGSPVEYTMPIDCKGQIQVRGLPADSAVLTVTFGDYSDQWLAGTGTAQANFAAGSSFRVESDRWQEVEIQTDLTQ